LLSGKTAAPMLIASVIVLPGVGSNRRRSTVRCSSSRLHSASSLPQRSYVDENGWPDGFFDHVAGSMPGLRRPSQGDFEERLPLD
jgi:hypothetical protein